MMIHESIVLLGYIWNSDFARGQRTIISYLSSAAVVSLSSSLREMGQPSVGISID